MEILLHKIIIRIQRDLCKPYQHNVQHIGNTVIRSYFLAFSSPGCVFTVTAKIIRHCYLPLTTRNNPFEWPLEETILILNLVLFHCGKVPLWYERKFIWKVNLFQQLPKSDVQCEKLLKEKNSENLGIWLSLGCQLWIFSSEGSGE